MSEALNPLTAQNIRGAGCREEMCYIDLFLLLFFCFLLISHYFFIRAYLWVVLGTVTMQQAEAADANEGGREKHTYN